MDIFAKDVVLIPINLGNAHWTFSCVNMRLKRIEYYDSLGGRRQVVYDVCLVPLYVYVSPSYQYLRLEPPPMDGLGA